MKEREESEITPCLAWEVVDSGAIPRGGGSWEDDELNF